MKASILLITAGAMLLGFSGASTPHTTSSSGVLGPLAAAGLAFTGVRAEYVDMAGNHWHVDTDCHIANTSATAPLTLKQIFVLGPDGVQSILGTYTGLVDKTVPPLGQVNLRIDSKIPGVVPQTTENGAGVRNVIVVWEGPTDALNLSATIMRYLPYNDTGFSRTIAEGYDLKF